MSKLAAECKQGQTLAKQVNCKKDPGPQASFTWRQCNKTHGEMCWISLRNYQLDRLVNQMDCCTRFKVNQNVSYHVIKLATSKNDIAK